MKRHVFDKGRLIESLERRLMLAVDPIISEIMADNESGIRDSFGINSDWLEIVNPDPRQSIDLTGWKLRYKNTTWNFPSMTLGPNQFRIIFATSRNLTDAAGELHTNFNLDKDGANLRLLNPGDQVVHGFAPYPEMQRDISYGVGQRVTETKFVSAGDVTKYFVPTSGSPGLTWTQPSFPDGAWLGGPTGIGFAGVVPGFAVTNYKGNVGSIANVGQAQAIVDNPANQSWKQSETAPYVNYLNTGGAGNFGSDRTYPGMTIGPDQNYFVTTAEGFVRIPAAGAWTFGVNSDDGFRLTVGGQTMQHDGLRGPGDTLATFNFPAAGDYALSLLGFENEGGASMELFAAQGPRGTFSPAFRLVGDTINGGLAVTSSAVIGGNGAAFASAIRTNVKSAMQAANNASIYTRRVFDAPNAGALTSLMLRMQYDDGFVAYLNGVEIARRNAPGALSWNSAATAARTSDLEATTFESIDVTSRIGLLTPTGNVLAIQVLNASAADNDLLMTAELSQTLIEPLDNHYFKLSTPGAANTPDTWQPDIDFSIRHGFYEQPISVALSTTTPGAGIYYTLDGSTPGATNGTLYTNPIGISTTKVVRAVSVVAGGQSGVVQTETYLFPETIINQPNNPPGMPGTWGPVAADYAMDPRITNDPLYKDTLKGALKSLPTMSLVTDVDHWFNPTSGLWANPNSELEKPVSVEYFDPEGDTEGFQLNAAMRIYGGVGRNPEFKKHSIRLIFKAPFGPTKLDYPLFDNGAVNSFDSIILRSNFNDGWNWGGAAAQFIRDEFARQLQIAVGQPGSHGNFVHLYVNGMYWGLFNPVERPDTSFAAKYMGGDKANWDAINAGAPINSSDPTSWNQLMGFNYEAGSNAAYQRLQGNNPTGTRNPAYPVLLDVNNYIDNLLVNFYLANTDWPGHNFYAARQKDPGSSGFKSFTWDAEWTIGIGSDANTNVLGINQGLGVPYANIRNNPEFQMLFADHVYKHMFNGGALTNDLVRARYDALAERIEEAVVAESARWGDVVGGFYTPNHWANERNRVLNSILAPRNTILIQQLRTAGLYPNIDAPTYSIAGTPKYGGTFEPGQSATISGPPGTIYYTLDGSDPRLLGGAISPTALTYSSAIPLSQSVAIKSRVFSNGTWSALADASFYIDLAPSIRITEVMYNPAPATQDEINRGYVATPDGNNDFEFLEIKNIGMQPLPLSGLRLTNGIDFTFGNISLAPGQYVLVVSDLEAFQIRYPSVNPAIIAGEYQGRLDSNGERVQLDAPSGGIIHDFEYNNTWYDPTDGRGFSLTVRDPAQDITLWDRNEGWRSSAGPGGSPGTADTLVNPESIVINEVLAHGTMPAGDMIELHNTTTQPIDIGGWFFSDTPTDLTKYQIPADTIIPGGEYLFLTQQAHFTAGLDYRGGDVYLSSNAAGLAGGYRAHVSFGAAPVGVSSGRVTKSTGATDFTLLQYNSFGSANGIALYSPLVVNEIMYHPRGPTPAETAAGYTDSQHFEFLELYNRTTAPLSLRDFYIGDGVGFSFGWIADGAAQKRTLESGATATWSAAGISGTHDVWVRLDTIGAERSRRPNLDNNATYAITHAGGTANVVIDQNQAQAVGNELWVNLGAYSFNGNAQVKLTRGTVTPGNWTIAGTIKLSQGGQDVILSDPTYNSMSTQRGITALAPGQVIVLVSNFAAFDARYGIAANNIAVAGVYTGNLDSNGEWIRLFQTAPAEADGFVPAYEVDRINYADNAPWPARADGLGPSLVRAHVAQYGNDAVNWQASNVPGTPGKANVLIDKSTPTIPANLSALASVGPARITLNWSASADPQSSVTHYVIHRDGQIIGTSASTSFVDATIDASTPYAYQITAVNRDGFESAKTAAVNLSLPGILSRDVRDHRFIDIFFNEPLDPATAGLLANYSIDAGAGLTNVALSRGNTLVTLTTAANLIGGTSYTVTMNNLTTASGNQMPASQQFTFSHLFSSVGTILREYWFGIGGNAVSDLTNNPAYPNSPSGRDLLTSFESPTGYGENYGQRVRGYLVPPMTGNYRFWIASDDNSELWLSPDDTSANKVLIARVTSWTSPREWANGGNPTQQSGLYFLEAGKRYYVEALMKEGNGGDNLAVRWQLPDLSWENGDANLPIPGNRLIPFGQPAAVVTPKAPTNLRGTIVNGTQVQLAWDAAPDAVTTVSHYVIYRDGVAFANSSIPSYTDTNAIGPKNRHSYQVAAVGFDNAQGPRTAIQSMVPLGISSVSSPDGNTVRVVFTEPVSAATAQNVANYVISGGITVNSAVREADGFTVTLTTTALGAITRTITVSNVRTTTDAPVPTQSESIFTAPPGWQVTVYKANFGTLNTLAQAQSVIDIPGNRLWTQSEIAPHINYWNSDSRGHFLSDRPVPGAVGDIENYVIRATAKMRVPTSGVYSFGVNSDDGFRLNIGNQFFQFDGGRGASDSIATFTLAAGAYDLTLLYFEGIGGSSVEVFGMAGNANGSFNANFKLLGDPTSPLTLGSIFSTAPFTVGVDALGTSDSTPEIRGTVSQPGIAVTVRVNGVYYAAGNNGNGTWTLPEGSIKSALAGGVYDISVAATDALGNLAYDATGNELVIDTIPPTSGIIPVSPNPRGTPLDSITIVFSKPVTGFDLADVHLTRGGGSDLIDGAQTLSSTDNITWTLAGLGSITAAAGSYTLTLAALGSEIADAGGNELAQNAIVSWSVIANGINGTAGDDAVRLVRNGTLTDVFVDGVFSHSFNPALQSQLFINLLAGNNSLELDYSNGDPLPAGGAVYSGDPATLGIVGTATLNIGSAQPWSQVRVSGGRLTLNAQLATQTLEIAPSGQLDLGAVGSGSLLLGAAGPLRQLLLAGYNGGSWTGSGGIVSSWAAADPSVRMIGYVSTPGGILVKSTVAGDVNLDLTVNNADFMTLYGNFGRADKLWGDGDLNYDGVVSFVDYQILSRNFGKSATAAPAPAAQPATVKEPPVSAPVRPAVKPRGAVRPPLAPKNPAVAERRVFSGVRVAAKR